MWQLNVNQWIRCLLMNPLVLVTQENTVTGFFSCYGTSLCLATCGWVAVSLLAHTGADYYCWCFLAALFHFAVTIPRQLRGWTPAWQRRRSPQRSVRMEVCKAALYPAGLLKHTVNRSTCIYTRADLCCICCTSHGSSLHTSHCHPVKQITSQVKCHSATCRPSDMSPKINPEHHSQTATFSWNLELKSTLRKSRLAFVSPGC